MTSLSLIVVMLFNYNYSDNVNFNSFSVSYVKHLQPMVCCCCTTADSMGIVMDSRFMSVRIQTLARSSQEPLRP